VHVDPDGVAMTNTPFVWNPSDDRFYFKKDSVVFNKLSKRYGLTREELDYEFKIRTRILYEMFRHNIFEFNEVQKVINEYYKDPKSVLTKFGLNQ